MCLNEVFQKGMLTKRYNKHYKSVPKGVLQEKRVSTKRFEQRL